MEIKFEKIDSVYVAEFEITSNCNIHIEREDLGRFIIESRGSKSGKYVPMEEGHYGDKYVIDVDMLGNIYPKYIKIKSVSKPTYAEVNFAEQSGGGNSGDVMIYKDVRGLNNADFLNIAPLIKAIVVIDDVTNEASIYAGPSSLVYNLNGFYYDVVKEIYAVGFNPEDIVSLKGGVGSLEDMLKQTSEELYTTLMACPDITKEEFYNTTA